MGNLRLSGRWLSQLALTAVLLGAVDCEKSTEAEQKPAASTVAAAPLEVPTAQPPKLNDQPVLAPPSLSPPEAATAGSPATAAKDAPLAPSAVATTTVVPVVTVPAAPIEKPKAPPAMPGAKPNTTSPGPMAPRTADTM